MTRIDILKKQQTKLKEDIGAMLDSFLIGVPAAIKNRGGR